MIIGIDASRANRPHKTGTEWYSYHLIRELAILDRDNQYILYSDTPLLGGLADLRPVPSAGNTQSKPRVDAAGWQRIESPHGNFRAKILKWPLLFFWTQGRLSLEMFKRETNALFVPAHTLPFFHPKKAVITIHDIGFERDRQLYRREAMGPGGRKSRWLINLLVRLFTLNKYGANSLDYLSWSTNFALKHADRIICVSQFTKREIEEVYGHRKDNIRVIYNGYDRELYRPITDEVAINAVLKKYDIARPFYLYVGRLEKKKNTPELVEAFARLKDDHPEIKHKLVLVGNASYGYDQVNYAIREYALDRDVIMPGWIEEADMPFIYNAAAAFIFPSRYEGFGIPLLEAMACGLPVAASYASSIPEVVGDAGIFFSPDNTREIAQAMFQLISDQELAADLKTKGLERVKRFGLPKCAIDTLDVITGKR